ncbi:MAG TPA: Mov34/MPN/PAD-1 family protein [Thermoanaerobaculia bacterium]|nr:Mov34/MPN/PAD-1 family protein [Thermoanaerobaculia bacterium]
MRAVLLSLLCAVPLSLVAQSHSALALANDGRVRAIFAELLRRGWYGLREAESAAFIVLDRTGCYSPVVWAHTGEKGRQTWRGSAPPFAVAIAHTHPKGSKRPSAVDVRTAGSVGLPVFVLTPTNIWVATPEGRAAPVVEEEEWARTVSSRGPCVPAKPPRLALSAE